MWYRIKATLVDPAWPQVKIKEVEIEGSGLTKAVQLLGTELLREHDGGAVVHNKHLRGVLLVSIELTTWTSSSSCAVPVEGAERALQRMKESAVAALSCGGSSHRLFTGTDRSGFSLN